jgi:ribonuclease VapC
VIVVDTSAIVAIFQQEEEAAHYVQCITTDNDPVISAASIVETSIVLRALKKAPSDRAERWLDQFIEAAGIRIEPVTQEQARIARSAHRRFGKGTGHDAALNYGDRFSYALAKERMPPCFARETTSRRPISVLSDGTSGFRAASKIDATMSAAVGRAVRTDASDPRTRLPH